MHSVHFRVSDDAYARIKEEADAQGSSVARFAREATIVRAALAANRRGFAWTDTRAWHTIAQFAGQIDRHDIALRAKLARERRQAS